MVLTLFSFRSSPLSSNQSSCRPPCLSSRSSLFFFPTYIMTLTPPPYQLQTSVVYDLSLRGLLPTQTTAVSQSIAQQEDGERSAKRARAEETA